MADEKKKRGPGRPPKSASERLEQTTVRLSQRTKRGLELLARLRRVSQSEAVAAAVQIAVRSTSVGDETLADILDSMGISDDSTLTKDIAPYRGALAIELRRHADKLLDPQEQFFLEFVKKAQGKYPNVRDPGVWFEIEPLWEFATEAYLRGIEVGAAAKLYKESLSKPR